MKKYDLRKIMKTAHEIYRKYFKLYQLTHGVQTFGDCMKVAWANEKKRIADEEARKAEKEAMQAALIQPERRSTYDASTLHLPPTTIQTAKVLSVLVT